MGLFSEGLESLRRKLANEPERDRAAEYARYCQLARQRGVEPSSFRKYCEAMDEYEREWDVANYEYDHNER